MAELVKLVYVGKKPTAYDNIARSGKTWNGKGDVQEVTEAQAKALLAFKDQWKLADKADADRVDAPSTFKVEDEDGDTVIVDPEDLKKPLEKMSKAELKAYAQDRWGKELDLTKGKKQLLDQVEEWDRDLDVTVGRVE